MNFTLTIDPANDVLTDILHATYLDARLLCRSEFAAPWGVTFANRGGASFHVVERGGCWLRMANGERLVPLAAGDLVILPNEIGHDLADSPTTTALPLQEMLSHRDEQERVTLAAGVGGLPVTLICGVFRYGSEGPHPLFSLLPALIHIKGEHGQAVDWLALSLRFIADEVAHQRPGYETLLSRLLDILFIMVLRYWIDHHEPGEGGWLSALHDPAVAKALGSIHRCPDQDWTIEKLAGQVNMSRSAFAAHFSALVGEPPIAYLTRWRMQLAMNRLQDESLSLEAIARAVGYRSVYAFSKTFKRMVGIAPGEYRKQRRKNATDGA